MAARDIKTSKDNRKVDIIYIFNSDTITKE